MALTLDAVGIIALVSAIGWWAVGIVSVVRSRVASPFERALATASFLIGALAFVAPYAPVSVAGTLADGTLANLRLTFIALATLLLLLATKWISRGHSRYDALLVVPVIASLALIWDGFVPNGFDSGWPSYVFWALQQIPYLAATIVLWGRLYRRRGDLATPVHQRFFWTVGILIMILAIGLGTNIAGRFVPPAVDPWLASVLLIPAAIALIAIVPLTREDWGEMLRVVSAIQERVTAVYMFYRTGEPLVALASNRNLPIEAEQLEAVLSVVGNFVETSVPSSRGYAVTAMRYEGLGLVAVRGEFVIIAAVYDGPAYDALRSELTRMLKVFEERSWKELRTWEDATKVAETAANELSNLLHRPERTAPPSLPHPSTHEAKPGKSS
jgi:hypothetical protein